MPFQNLLAKLRQRPAPAPTELPYPHPELAVAALLIEAAQVDGSIPESERAVIVRLIREHFHLPEQESEALLQIAEGEFSAALDDWVFTQAVRESFAKPERQTVLEMMWQVVYADGSLAHFEDALLNRSAQALGLSAEEADAARERAYARYCDGRDEGAA
ncbi:hypothetical protein BURK2_00572 [Burkholderiales bacterium]|nr:hypothetical protein BURK2_00572 [Burkholderiales bacterium]